MRPFHPMIVIALLTLLAPGDGEPRFGFTRS